MTSCCCYWCEVLSAIPPRFQEQSTKQECVEVCRISLHQPHCINTLSVLAWAHSHVWKGEEGRFVAARRLRSSWRRKNIYFLVHRSRACFKRGFVQHICFLCVCESILLVSSCSLHCLRWDSSLHADFYDLRNSCFYLFCSHFCLLTMMQNKLALGCCTFTGFLMEIVARWADTSVRAIHIQTSSCTTGAWIHCTFIYIWGKRKIQLIYC